MVTLKLEEREVRVVDVLDEATILMPDSNDSVGWADSDVDTAPIPSSTPSIKTMQNL